MTYNSDLNNEFPSFPLHKPPQLLSSLSLPGKVKFTLEQAMKAQHGRISIPLSFFNLEARWVWVVKVPSRSLYSWEKKGIDFTGGWGSRAGLDSYG